MEADNTNEQDETNDKLEEQLYIERLKSKYDLHFQKYKADCDLHLQQYTAKCNLQLQEYKEENTFNIEMFRSVMLAAHAALKSTIIINGGAAVAMLAFIGNIWVKNQAAIVGLSTSLICYVIAVLCGAMASGATYITQDCYNKEKNKTGEAIRIIVIVLVLASYILFACGTRNAYKSFTTYSKANSNVQGAL